MRIVCVLMQRNERELLAPWIEYHARLCGRDNLHIFDNGSDDPETLRILKHYRENGVDIDFSYASRADFNRKGEIIAAKIRSLDRLGGRDFFFPLDCDEFLACRNGRGVDVEPDAVFAELQGYRGDPRVLMIAGTMDNNPRHPDHYRFEPGQRKCFFAQGACLSLDIGFHYGRAVKTDETHYTNIVYFHLHNRPFAAQQYFSAQKLQGRVTSFETSELEAYERLQLPGFHLVPELLADLNEYNARHAARPPLYLPQLSQALERLGAPLALSGDYRTPDLPVRGEARKRPPRGYIDSAIVVGLTLKIDGWALDGDGRPARPYSVRIGDAEVETIVAMPVSRLDVARAHGLEETLSGFSVEASLIDVPADCLAQEGVALAVQSATGATAWLVAPPGCKPDLSLVQRVLENRPEIAGRPGLTSNALAHFERRLAQARTYLEYGMGGTTVRAAEGGVTTVVAIESDPVWFDLVRHRTGVAGEGRRHLLRADIGPTGEWGFPTDDTGWRNYSRYALEPWTLCHDQKIEPDLVLIDGRFRLACGLAALLHAKPGTCILFDDYVDRPYYQPIERFVQPRQTIDNMVEFSVPALLDRDQVWSALMHAVTDPR